MSVSRRTASEGKPCPETAEAADAAEAVGTTGEAGAGHAPEKPDMREMPAMVGDSATTGASAARSGSGADSDAADAAAPDLLYSDEEEELRSAVRRLLGDHCAPADVLARIESEAPYDPELWRLLAEDMGLAGLLVPERLGGVGATHREAAVVLEELGRAVAPVPFLTSAVIATEALLGCLADHAGGASPDAGSEDVTAGTGAEGKDGERVQQHGPFADGPVTDLLAELASGRRIAVLAVPLTAGPPTRTAPGAGTGTGTAAGPGAACVRRADGTLHGRIGGIADAAAADVLLVPAGTGLYAVDTRQEGVLVASRTALDRTRPIADVTFTAARAQHLTAHAQQVLRRALNAGAGLLASEQLGVADWCLTETVRHTRERHQFNRPVGSFQSLKHRLAQVWLRLVHTRAAARNAADVLATGGPETALAVALAQSCASDAAVHAAEEALQLHGGIGMTWEHPVHLYLKRAKADSIALGTAARHREQIGLLADLAPPAC